MTESLTNMEAVQPKGPKLFVAALALAAAGGVAWFFLGREPGPVGEPEDPGKILLVGADDPAAPLVEQLGFVIEQRSLDDAAAEGRTAGSTAESDIDAALYYADHAGYGYAAFADAGNLDFGARAVSTDSATIGNDHRYAVFSIGDLAEPTTKVTVDPTPHLYDVPAHAELLAALFEQDKLAATLVGETNLSIEAQPLFERIKSAVELQGAFGLVGQLAASADKRLREYVTDSEEADPRPKVLSENLERSHGYALANGSALLLVDAPVLHNPTRADVKLDWSGQSRAWTYDLDSGERTRCEAADRIRPGSQVHAGGAAIVSRWGDGELMVFTVDPKARGCALQTAGTIVAGMGAWGNANASGKVVRSAAHDEVLEAEIHTPDARHPQTWPLAGCTSVSSPIWIDDTHIATACEYRPPIPGLNSFDDLDDEPLAQDPEEPAPPPVPEQRWLYLVSLEDGSALAAPLPEHSFAPRLWVRPTPSGLSLVAEHGVDAIVYTFTSDIDALFAAPPLDPELPHPAYVADPSAGVRALRADAYRSAKIETDGALGDFVISTDGASMAFGVDAAGEFDRNLAIYDFATGKTRRFAINEWARHFAPTFGPDGRTVVFNSTYSTRNFQRATVAQAVTLPGS